MRFTFIALGAIALSGVAAHASDTGSISGTFSLGYDYNRIAHQDVDTYGFDSALNYVVQSGLNLQFNLSYSEPKVSDIPIDNWTAGGAAFWRSTDFAAGLYGTNTWVKAVGVSTTYGTYGAIGEWYPTGSITVRLRGGGLTADGAKGGQIGGGSSYYIIPNLSLNFDAAYLNAASLHRTNFNLGAEYLLFESFPLTASAAYTYTQYNAAGMYAGGSGVMFRLSYRFGSGTTLVDRDRSGPLNTYWTPLLDM